MNSNSIYDRSIRESSVQPHIVAYYYKQWDGFDMPFHKHDAVEIMYVISGKCMVELNENEEAGKAEETELTLKKGDFILIDAEVEHRLIVQEDEPCRMLNVEFIFTKQVSQFPALKELIDQEPALQTFLSSKQDYVVLRDPHDIYHTLKSLVLELDESDMSNQLMIQLLMAQLLVRIARIVNEEGAQGTKPNDHYIKQSIQFMQQNYDRDIRVKDIADAVNLHSGYLHRLFSNAMDCTIVEYLTTLRMQKAQMLLSQTDIPVSEIADYVGVSSQQYFSTVFKKHTGQSPVSYRKASERIKWNH